jgi:glycosyltransferase involved in cell wall biosynthesis
MGGFGLRVTVAICTLNRAESLRRTLESLEAMRVPSNLDWEVIVVNNRCTDHTDEVIQSFAERLPIRRELESEQGLSNARNRAIDAANGDYILWTDDDVVVDPRWLAAYLAAFIRWPEGAVFGGPIVPRYALPMPKWLSESKGLLQNSVFGGRDCGDQELPLSIADRNLPWGPNFALRACEQQAFRYNLQLGHASSQRRRGEELDVIERILRSGASGYWLPAARVEHCSNPGQQTLKYVIRYFATVGETAAFCEDRGTHLQFGVPRWLWRQLVLGWLLYRLHRLISPAPVWIRHLRDYAHAWGAVRYYWRTASGRDDAARRGRT